METRDLSRTKGQIVPGTVQLRTGYGLIKTVFLRIILSLLVFVWFNREERIVAASYGLSLLIFRMY